MRILPLGLPWINIRHDKVQNTAQAPMTRGAVLVRPLSRDTVSFTSKNPLDVKTPTNHCAYCGEKLYPQKELDGICQELLSLNSHRLDGKIISIIKKLELTGQTSALAERKREVNANEIEFFKDFADKAQKHTRLSGREILSEFYEKTGDTATDYLKQKVSPLLRTIDHILPQKTKNGNIDDEMNLVEACYTCNNHIKNGEHFYTFLSLYPSIRDYMPHEKYEYASLDLIKNPSGVSTKVTTDVLKRIDDAQIGQREAINRAGAFGTLIQTLLPAAETELKRINGEIAHNNGQIDELQTKLKQANNDPEFVMMCKKTVLEKTVETLDTDTSSLSQQINAKNRYIAMVKNAPIASTIDKYDKKNKFTVKSEKERSARIRDAAYGRKALIEQHKKVFAQLQTQRAQLASLDVKQIDITPLYEQKSKYASIIEAHNTLGADKAKLAKTAEAVEELQKKYDAVAPEQKHRSFAQRMKSKLRQNVADQTHLQRVIRDKEALRAICTLQEAQKGFDKNDLLIKQHESQLKESDEKQSWLEIERNIKALEHDNNILRAYADALQLKINECRSQ